MDIWHNEKIMKIMDNRREKKREKSPITFDCYNALINSNMPSTPVTCKCNHSMGKLDLIHVLSGKSAANCEDCPDRDE